MSPKFSKLAKGGPELTSDISRAFFLQVKESLTHVQLLLDHQLMDMAWSDNLIDCEESLLKASVHLQSSPNSSSSQGRCADSMNEMGFYPVVIQSCPLMTSAVLVEEN